MSQTFARWQPVEVLYDREWTEARYLEPYDDKISDLAHDVVVFVMDTPFTPTFADHEIRPLPRFEATGDELPLLAGLLAEVEQRMTNTDMSNSGTISPETAAVNAMMRRCWAAMGGAR